MRDHDKNREFRSAQLIYLLCFALLCHAPHWFRDRWWCSKEQIYSNVLINISLSESQSIIMKRAHSQYPEITKMPQHKYRKQYAGSPDLLHKNEIILVVNFFLGTKWKFSQDERIIRIYPDLIWCWPLCFGCHHHQTSATAIELFGFNLRSKETIWATIQNKTFGNLSWSECATHAPAYIPFQTDFVSNIPRIWLTSNCESDNNTNTYTRKFQKMKALHVRN